MSLLVAFNVLVLFIVLGFLYYLQKTYVSYNKRVFAGLGLGILVGVIMRFIFSTDVLASTADIYSIVGTGYVKFLQMIIYPIVIVATLSAMTKIGENAKAAKSIVLIIAILLITTAIAAIVAIGYTYMFNFDIEDLMLLMNPETTTSFDALTERQSLLERPFYTLFTDFITTNPFLDLTGARPTSVASLVLFSIFVGIAYLGVKRKEPEIAAKFYSGVQVVMTIVMRLVVLVLRLTPYGIFAIIWNIVVSSDLNSMSQLFNFIIANYLAMITMFGIHLLLLTMFKINPLTFIKKAFPVFLFAFASRSSLASIPMNISIQTKGFGIPESNASLSSTFGAIIGQNGCAGVYPAMLAIITAPLVGIDPTNITFLVMLILIIMINSFGIAGVGGGATFAALAVFGAFNMPVFLIVILVGIEPILDMGRTALNVSGINTASLITSRVTKQIDDEVLKA